MYRVARSWTVVLAAIGLVLAGACSDADDGEAGTGTIDWWTISNADSELGRVWARLGDDFNA